MNISPTADCRVLVVDDSPDIATLIQLYAKDLPISLVVAETAEAGLSKLKESRFDMVLMDYYLPDISGAEAVRKLRRWERQRRVPAAAVYALTDLRDFESSEQMLMAGCTSLLGKPLSRHQFLTAVGRRRAAPNLRHKNAQAAA